MGVEVIMPQLGMNMSEGTLVKWLKGEGDACAKGEVIAVIETDKALADIEAPAAGVLTGPTIRAGDSVPVGTVIAYVRTADEPADAPASTEVSSTPGARRLARSAGVALSAIPPNRPGARLTEEDVQRFLLASPADTTTGPVPAPTTTQPWSDEAADSIRLATARKMEVAGEIPHFYLQAWADITTWSAAAPGTAVKLKRAADDIVIRACASVLRQRPRLLCSWLDGTIRRYQEVNIGFAVQTTHGLMVPVIRNADRLDAEALTEQRRLLVEKARARRLSVEDVSGGTFTVTNLGVFNVELAWPLLNSPQAGILAVGRANWRPIFLEAGFEPRLELGLTLAADHRVIDGADAAEFLDDLVRKLGEAA